MKDKLVVYFSRDGYTRRMAEHIAGALDADCEPIRERHSRKGIFGYWRSAREALRGSAVEIQPLERNPRDYQLVVIGTPVWAGNISSPVRAFVEKYRNDLPRVALFCTQGGSGATKVLRRLASLCGSTPRATTFFNDSEIDRAQFAGKLEKFTAALTAPPPA